MGGEESVKKSVAQKESKNKEERKKQKTEKEPDSIGTRRDFKDEVQRRKKRKTQTAKIKNLTE